MNTLFDEANRDKKLILLLLFYWCTLPNTLHLTHMKMTVLCVVSPHSQVDYIHGDKAVSTSRKSVSFWQSTWRNIAEDNHIHTCRHQNLKIHLALKTSNFRTVAMCAMVDMKQTFCTTFGCMTVAFCHPHFHMPSSIR